MLGSRLWFDFSCFLRAGPGDQTDAVEEPAFQRVYGALVREIVGREGAGLVGDEVDLFPVVETSAEGPAEGGQVQEPLAPFKVQDSAVNWDADFLRTAGVRLRVDAFGSDMMDAVCISMLRMMQQKEKVPTDFIKFLICHVVMDTSSALRLSALLARSVG